MMHWLETSSALDTRRKNKRYFNWTVTCDKKKCVLYIHIYSIIDRMDITGFTCIYCRRSAEWLDAETQRDKYQSQISKQDFRNHNGSREFTIANLIFVQHATFVTVLCIWVYISKKKCIWRTSRRVFFFRAPNDPIPLACCRDIGNRTNCFPPYSRFSNYEAHKYVPYPYGEFVGRDIG